MIRPREFFQTTATAANKLYQVKQAVVEIVCFLNKRKRINVKFP